MDNKPTTNAHWILPIAISLAINAVGVVFAAGESTSRLEVIREDISVLKAQETNKVNKEEFQEMKQDIKEIRQYLMNQHQPSK